jgi:flavin reductase (DIM6/NTAB) family NADH-FMN oxidoreductase RutF
LEQKLSVSAELLKESMRRWVTGVAIVTSRDLQEIHGMTVNSFTSVSILPPLIIVTLAKATRTYKMVMKTGLLGITLLSENQKIISERFAGLISEDKDRFDGLETFELISGVPFIDGGLSFMDCEVQKSYEMDSSTLFIARVNAIKLSTGRPLIYQNHGYYQLGDTI